MFYIRCCMLVFIHFSLLINYLALKKSLFQTPTNYPRSTNLFCFFERWTKSPVCYLGGLWKLFGKALDLAMARGALAMCLQIGLANFIKVLQVNKQQPELFLNHLIKPFKILLICLFIRIFMSFILCYT